MYLCETPLKTYYCTAKCYADDYFVRACARACKVDSKAIRADVNLMFASDPLVQRKMTAWADRYDEITYGIRNSPAYKAFVERAAEQDEEVAALEAEQRRETHEQVLLAAQVQEHADALIETSMYA